MFLIFIISCLLLAGVIFHLFDQIEKQERRRK